MAIDSGNTEMTQDRQTRWIEETKTWFISDAVMVYLDIFLSVSIHGILSVTGIISNLLNTIIFVKLELKDSMSIGLVTLSLTDLAVTIMQLGSSFSYLVNLVYPDSPLDLWLFGGYVFSWTRYVAYLISCWITTVISVERCFCVVSPFTVRQVFTRPRCAAVLLIIFLIHIGIHLPIFIYARLEWTQLSDARNASIAGRYVLTVIFNDNSARWEILSDMIAGISLSILSQVILIICTVWMIYSLKASSKIRRSTKNSATQGKEQSATSTDSDGAMLSTKERRLVRVVLFMAINLSLCNIPRFLIITVHHILPGMNLGAYQNLDTFFWEISYIFGTICCTLNTLVYYVLNTKYRLVLKQMLLKCS